MRGMTVPWSFAFGCAFALQTPYARAQAPAGQNSVDFVTDEAGLTVLKRPVTESWREGHPPSDDEFSVVCLAPCRARLDGAAYQFAVSRADGVVLPSPTAYEVHGAAAFRAEVLSHADTRTTGYAVLGGLGGAGFISTSAALSMSCGEDRECAKWTSIAFWGGLGAISLSALIGLPMVLRKDELTLSVMPVQPLPGATRPPFGPRRDEFSAALGGLTLSGAF